MLSFDLLFPIFAFGLVITAIVMQGVIQAKVEASPKKPERKQTEKSGLHPIPSRATT